MAGAVATANENGSSAGGKAVSDPLRSSANIDIAVAAGSGSLGGFSSFDSSSYHRTPAHVAITRRELHDALLEYKWADGVALIAEV